MKSFLVISLLALGVAHGRILSSNDAKSSWNSFLNAQNLFSAELDDSLDFSSRDGLTIHQQLDAVLGPEPNLELIYSNYLANYNVEVAPVPRATRLELFKKFLHSIAAHNVEARAGLHTWTKGVTRFADRTPEEWAQYLSPVPMVEVKTNNSISFKESPFYPLYELLLKNAPSSLDYRDEGIVTPVKDQTIGCKGGEGSCYAFAATSMAESAYARKNNKKQISLAEYEIVTCANGENGLDGCDGGDLYFTLLWMKKGLALEQDMPAYKGTKKEQMTCPADTNSKPHFAKVLDLEDIREDNGAEDQLLALLLAHGPVGVAVGADDTWSYYTKGSGVFDGSCDPDRNHGVVVVGYTPDAWIVKNSWATKWGEDGYMYLKRGVNKCHVGERLRAITSLG